MKIEAEIQRTNKKELNDLLVSPFYETVNKPVKTIRKITKISYLGAVYVYMEGGRS